MRAGARVWRVLRTAFAYAAFGAGSLALALTAVPAIRLLAPDASSGELRVQRLAHAVLRAYLRGVEVLRLARVRCDRPDRLRRPGTLVVANHPTRLDAVALIGFMPQADCIVKQGYFDNVVLRGIVGAAGYIPNRGGSEVVEACVGRLLRGRSLMIFPEGTRSPRSGLATFQRGAAHIALRAGCDVLPVFVRCCPPTLGKGERWWAVPEQAFELSLEVGEPIAVKEVVAEQPTRALAARALTREIREHFEQRISSDRTS
jgi:1-acyl-sn-glycerol-3-phosphate acyltransferase